MAPEDILEDWLALARAIHASFESADDQLIDGYVESRTRFVELLGSTPAAVAARCRDLAIEILAVEAQIAACARERLSTLSHELCQMHGSAAAVRRYGGLQGGRSSLIDSEF